MVGHTSDKAEALTNQLRVFFLVKQSTESDAGQQNDYPLKGKRTLSSAHTHISVDIGQTLPFSQGQVQNVHDKAHS